ncbi:hypothetical protein JQ633_28385 [Bradyrhizobium tropiciagri]|uniref:sigma factor-like helix-turn-helix DNA-binding protein n=1 Tax=Bradyrhizobium tropiciagri TaxID=312253 RepID=UPI001BA6D9B7|nr:sigma factor-like helix-turn-helix DNA-binding protein [Bradyrhizobium tropiciagri]MBR0874304.1 hypothetical protein [Bradyrhizobium tropiciagri]
MMRSSKVGNKTAQAFRDATVPWLDDVYGFAHVLMRNQNDAEQAAEECYQRALRLFDGFRGPAVKPWLLAILRTVCQERLALRAPPQDAAAAAASDRRGKATIRELVDELPALLGETIALRDYLDLSYREIGEVTGVPVSTVMSRIAEARALLLAARRAANEAAQAPPEGRTAGGASGLTVYRRCAC